MKILLDRKKLFAAIFSCLCLGGCILAPALQSISDVGMTQGDRQALLARRINEFHDALFWGNPDIVLTFVEPAAMPELRQALRRQSKSGERIVESKVESVQFSNDSWEAEAEVTVKSYKVSFYVVNERHQIEKWKFHLSGGWKIASIKSDASY